MTVMAEDIDRSGLFNEIRQFSQRKLKKVETKETTGSGEVLTVKRNAKGLQTLKSEGIKAPGYVVDHKPDLQVGMVIPGLFIGSQDVAQDKKTLDAFEITHILNLAYGVENAYEDDYNYKKLDILDVPETDIRKYFDECFEFIDEGRQRGNCLVHCNAGVSRSCAICCAYLMTKEKKTFDDALNAVREARPFSRPNDGFTKQLKEFDEELKGSHGLKEANVDDSFTARQRAEIEAEKAALLSSNASVKNKLKQFGATLDAHFAQRAKFINSPIKLPLKKKPQNDTNANNKMIPPPPLPPNVPPPPPPPPQLMNQKIKPQTQPQPQRSRPEPIKMREEPKKLIINNDMNNRITEPNTNPSVDETPISVKAFRKNFEMNNNNNKMEIPKVQRTPATPKTNAMTNNPWSKPQTPIPAPEDKKKKIIIKQRSKEAEEVPQRRSTKDLVDAIEKAKSPSTSPSNQQQLPYGQRRRQTTQLVDTNNTSNDTNQQPLAVRQRMREFEGKGATPPPQSRTITLMKQSSASPSPAASSPMSSNRNSPIPPVSHSPSPHPSDSESNPKMVFGRVRPPRLSITGRTLSQASQTLQDVSKATNNDSTTSSLTASASNSRSESPVSAVGHTRDTKTTSKSASKTSKPCESGKPCAAVPAVQSMATTNANANAKPVSDNVANKWTSNASLNMNKTNAKQKSVSPNSSSEESSEEESEDKNFKSALSMQMKPFNKTNKNNEPQNDSSLTEPSNERFNTKRVPLGKIGGQQSLEKNKTGLNRSSSAAILKLIKSNTRTDIGLDRVEEDDEIEALLLELEKEGVDNIDWDELNVDQKKVKEIIDNEKVDESSDEEDDEEESSSDDDDSDDDEAVHMVINRQAPEESDKSDADFEVVDDDEESD